MSENQQLWSFVDETKEGMPVRKIPYKPIDFIPFIGLIAHQFRVNREGSRLEKVIEKHGNPVIPAYLEGAVGRYMDSLIWDWRAKHLRKNFDWKFDLYHLTTTAIPLVYAIASSYQ